MKNKAESWAHLRWSWLLWNLYVRFTSKLEIFIPLRSSAHTKLHVGNIYRGKKSEVKLQNYLQHGNFFQTSPRLQSFHFNSVWVGIRGKLSWCYGGERRHESMSKKKETNSNKSHLTSFQIKSLKRFRTFSITRFHIKTIPQ